MIDILLGLVYGNTKVWLRQIVTFSKIIAVLMTTSSSFISLMNLNLRVSSWRRAVAQNHEKVFKSNTRPKNQYYLKVACRTGGTGGAKVARGPAAPFASQSGCKYQIMWCRIDGQQAYWLQGPKQWSGIIESSFELIFIIQVQNDLTCHFEPVLLP